MRELSSQAWLNGFYDKIIERVPTLKSELEDIVSRNPGHLIATSACIGGELSSNILSLLNARATGDKDGEVVAYNNIINFIDFCVKLFKDDFYIEIAPGASKEQIAANKMLITIARKYGFKIIIGDDSHYLKREDRFVHKAYLNSEEGDREVDAFYQYAYLHNEEDCIRDLAPTFKEDIRGAEFYYQILCANSMDMFNKIEVYDIRHAQTIPSVDVKDYPKKENCGIGKQFPILREMYVSDDKYERYWVNECVHKLYQLEKNNNTYFSELEHEAKVKKTIGEKLGTNIFKYPITLQHYIDMMWDCGSLVGAGRGSSCAGLNHYLLGVTQLDPIKWNLPFFRYLNVDRLELP